MNGRTVIEIPRDDPVPVPSYSIGEDSDPVSLSDVQDGGGGGGGDDLWPLRLTTLLKFLYFYFSSNKV